MTRKGYRAEYLAKKELIKEYGKRNVVKVAIGGATDYLVLTHSRLVTCIKKIVEVKECHKKVYYPSEREKEQFKRIALLSGLWNCEAEVWVKFPRRDFIKVPVGTFSIMKCVEKRGVN